jgi:hypothetical protein
VPQSRRRLVSVSCPNDSRSSRDGTYSPPLQTRLEAVMFHATVRGPAARLRSFWRWITRIEYVPCLDVPDDAQSGQCGGRLPAHAAVLEASSTMLAHTSETRPPSLDSPPHGLASMRAIAIWCRMRQTRHARPTGVGNIKAVPGHERERHFRGCGCSPCVSWKRILNPSGQYPRRAMYSG